mmetsp:Transcript_60847/g.143730  ORF Transcript_60847/g.143730 Transcript_60847/m.143730 type:complete len:92 (+) Transcript_60847:3-278(+)
MRHDCTHSTTNITRIVSRDTLPPANSVPALGRNVSTRSEPRFAPETAFARAAEFISTDGSESMATQEAELISRGSVGDGTIDSSTEDSAIS